MQAIIVPTDFSPASYNAARYAIAFATDIKATKIILYNAYEAYVARDPELGLPLQLDLDEYKKISVDGLKKMKDELQNETSPSAELLMESDYNMIKIGVLDSCKNHNAELIVMSITEAETKLEEAVIGSSAIDVARESKVPVIIVPAKAKYSKPEKVLLAIDFKKIETSLPVDAIKNLLDATNAKLDILHVEAHKHNDTNFDKAQNILNDLFNSYNPQFHFLESNHFTEAINKFVDENNSNLVIMFPKKHGLLEGIFKESHTKALAFHSHVPVITIHE